MFHWHVCGFYCGGGGGGGVVVVVFLDNLDYKFFYCSHELVFYTCFTGVNYLDSDFFVMFL